MIFNVTDKYKFTTNLNFTEESEFDQEIVQKTVIRLILSEKYENKLGPSCAKLRPACLCVASLH